MLFWKKGTKPQQPEKEKLEKKEAVKAPPATTTRKGGCC